jgi:two-component system, chemotaxis family, CheB/CheR fusion protein
LQPADAPMSSGVEHSTEHLEQELRDTRERLQATIEEYETALEELKAANEEMVSVNEELQSTNEELETSKEELQSVNEELQTVNLELNGKIDELDHANADLRNLFESTRIASVFLDRHMVIRSFTPAATTIFNLISTDRGRPLTDIVSGVELGDLKREIGVVLDSGQLIERNVRRADGRAHYMMRLLPYLGRHNVIEGVIVTFFEVTKIIEGETQQRALVEEMNHRVRNMLTVVHAVATQTINRSSALQDFSDVFLGRIQSMAKSYTLLAREQWAPVPLRDILDTELEQYQTGDKDRVAVSGPYIAFAPQVAVGLGLVFHELATNAAKYGGLAKDEGKLAVQWVIETGKDGAHALVMDWKESKGLPVKAPERNGFGSDLIDREIKGTLQGSIVRDFATSGLRIKITLPIDGRAHLSAAAR